MRVPSLQGRPVRVADPTLHYDSKVLLTRTEAWTAVELPLRPYAFTSADERVRLGWLATMSWAALKTGQVTVKSVHQRPDVAGAARALDEQVRAQGSPAAGWPEYLRGQQDRRAEAEPSRKRVFALARLGARSIPAQVARLRAEPFAPVAAREVARWHEAAARRRETLERGGLGAVPLGSEGLRGLRRYALTRGEVVPSASGRRLWGPGEVLSEFDDVEVVPGPRWVRVDDGGVSRYCATFVCSTFPAEMAFPETDPWLAHLDRLDFPVDSDLVLDLIGHRQAAAHVLHRLRVARDQHADAARAAEELPIEVEQMLSLARELQWSIPRRRLPLAYGWARIRVHAEDPAGLSDRFTAVEDHMKALGIDVVWPSGQAQVDLHVEGVPGVPRRHRSWRQRWLLETAACALPQAASGLGHEDGSYVGRTTGRQRRAVGLNLHSAIVRRHERDTEGAGGVVLLGQQRSGKSSALSMLIYDGTQRGTTTIALDPSGPLGRLARLPEFEGRADTFDLLDAGGGIADPLGPVLVPYPPGPERTGDAVLDGLAEAEWQSQRARVRRERSSLARETFTTLAWRQVQADADAETELLGAISRVALSQESSTQAVIEVLRGSRAKAARNLGAHLGFELEADEAGALAGEGAAPVAAGATTRIISMRGLAGVLPEPGRPIGDWLPSQALAAATFGCGAYLARRLLYALPPEVLKTLIIDEAHVPMATPSGRRVIEGSLRDGPKHGLVTVLATHNAADLADERIVGAVSMWFLFRATSSVELARSFEAARIEDTAQNREYRRTLDNGECIAVLDDDVRDRFRWDLWVPSLAAAARTTPGRRVEARSVPVQVAAGAVA